MQVRKPIEFLSGIIMHIVGEAVMSMEGDLSRCSFEDLEGYGTEPVPPLKIYRLMASGGYDYAIFTISDRNKNKLIKSVFPRIGLRTHVWHIEIAQNGILIFGSYNNFHPKCAWLDKSIGDGILQAMVNEKIVLSYKLVEVDD